MRMQIECEYRRCAVNSGCSETLLSVGGQQRYKIQIASSFFNFIGELSASLLLLAAIFYS